MQTTISNSFFKRGAEFLGVRYPILCGAMTWVSTPQLVAAVSDAGGFGCLAGGNTPTDILRAQIEEARGLTDKPFGVNLVTIAPAYRDQLDLVCEMNLPIIIFAGSFPRGGEVRKAKESGARVMAFASTLSIAKRMVNYGVDAIILEGMEAGGHVGHVTLSVLLQQVLFQMDEVPIFCAGGIATGKMCAHLLMMGAAGVQLGTRFAVARESCTHEKFKESFFKAQARDAISTPQFDSRLPVVAVRALRNRGLAEFGRLQLDLISQLDAGTISRHDAQIEVEKYWMGALRRAVQDGDVEAGSLMAGQSVGLVNSEESISEIVDDLVNGIESELQLVRNRLSNA